jgi:ribose 5-phosphate isomerase B
MKLALGCDHGGYALMQEVKKHLDEMTDVEYVDFGTDSEESCDYPVYGEAAANAVARGECDLGILICGTGIGISISANKVKGIRAALCSDCFSAEMTRRHNDANMLCMGARVLGTGLALKIVDTFLASDFDGGRHAKRIALISDIESRQA